MERQPESVSVQQKRHYVNSSMGKDLLVQIHFDGLAIKLSDKFSTVREQRPDVAKLVPEGRGIVEALGGQIFEGELLRNKPPFL